VKGRVGGASPPPPKKLPLRHWWDCCLSDMKGIQPVNRLVSLIPKSSFVQQVEEENRRRIVWPRFTWKLAVETEVVELAKLKCHLLNFVSVISYDTTSSTASTGITLLSCDVFVCRVCGQRERAVMTCWMTTRSARCQLLILMMKMNRITQHRYS